MSLQIAVEKVRWLAAGLLELMAVMPISLRMWRNI